MGLFGNDEKLQSGRRSQPWWPFASSLKPKEETGNREGLLGRASLVIPPWSTQGVKASPFGLFHFKWGFCLFIFNNINPLTQNGDGTFLRSHSLAVPKPWPEPRLLLASLGLVISYVLPSIVTKARGRREKRRRCDQWDMPCRGEAFLCGLRWGEEVPEGLGSSLTYQTREYGQVI